MYIDDQFDQFNLKFEENITWNIKNRNLINVTAKQWF